jgi:4-phytase/acid phosphatase
MQNTLCPTKNCFLKVDEPAALVLENEKWKLKWNGRFSIGSTAAEIFLLEYAHGMPCATVGWGKVAFNQPDCGQGQSFRAMQELHTAYFQETQRAPYIAKVQGTPLLNEIAGRLSQGMQPNPAAQKLVIFAGHDTNIANVAAMLGVCWKLPDLPENDTPPAGALVFELHRSTQTSKYSLQIRYVYQMVEQLRTKSGLTLERPPKWIDVAVPRCQGVCDLETFKQLVANPESKPQACTAHAPK